MTAKRPRRQKKADRLLWTEQNKADIQCDYAIGPMDRVAVEMDRKWGIDRLPELVSPETATKFGTAMAQMNAALDAKDPELATHKAGVVMRGLRAMDAEAERLGHKPATGDFWEYEVSGFRFAVLKDGVEWMAAKERRPDLNFYTLREIGLALKAYAEIVPLEAAKQHFPDAEITKLPPISTSDDLNDPIPF